MSTRSRIGHTLPDGTIQSIYCHSDGYPEHNGKMLREFYHSKQKVIELVALGDLSCLHPLVAPMPGQPHSYSNRAHNVTVAYARDRNEKDVASCNYENLDTWLALEEEYHYLFDDGKWFMWDHPHAGADNHRYELTPALVIATLDV